MKPSREEMETHFTFSAADRRSCIVFSDDPWFQRKLERVGAIVTKEMTGGGKEYHMEAKQVSLRKRKDKSALSEQERLKINARMQAMRIKRDAADEVRSERILEGIKSRPG